MHLSNLPRDWPDLCKFGPSVSPLFGHVLLSLKKRWLKNFISISRKLSVSRSPPRNVLYQRLKSKTKKGHRDTGPRKNKHLFLPPDWTPPTSRLVTVCFGGLGSLSKSEKHGPRGAIWSEKKRVFREKRLREKRVKNDPFFFDPFFAFFSLFS